MFFASGPLEQAVSNNAAGFEPTPEQQRMFGYGNYDLAGEYARRTIWPAIMSADALHRRRRLFGSARSILGHAVRPCSTATVSPIMPTRLTEREAYRRGKDEDNKLIAEMQAAGNRTGEVGGEA